MSKLFLLAAFVVAMTMAASPVDKQRLLKLINENPGVSDHYVDLGNTLSADDRVTLLPKSLSRTEAYLLAIQIDPNNAVAYNNLGVTLKSIDETVLLIDGVTKLSKQELFLKAIETDPKFGHAYNNLAETMQPDQKMNYPDGRQLTRREMFVKSIELDPAYPYAFNNLGVILSDASADHEDNKDSGNTVTLANGSILNARSAFLHCIELGDHPALHHCYRNLAQLLEDKEVVQLLGKNGDRVDKDECIRRAGAAKTSAGISDEDEDM